MNTESWRLRCNDYIMYLSSQKYTVLFSAVFHIFTLTLVVWSWLQKESVERNKKATPEFLWDVFFFVWCVQWSSLHAASSHPYMWRYRGCAFKFVLFCSVISPISSGKPAGKKGEYLYLHRNPGNITNHLFVRHLLPRWTNHHTSPH